MSVTTEERTTRLRTPPAKGVADGASAIDRKAGIIHGFSVIQKGPALGHGSEIDEKTLEQVRDLGNSAKAGSKMRFTHPNMSNDGLGKYLGRAKNFRIVGDRVLADAHIADTAYETPSGDLASYVFDLAEEDPSAFAASISFHGQTEKQTNEDGTIAKDKPPLVRVTRLQAVDLVDSPAANRDGLLTELSEETLPDWPARQVSHALDQVFSDKSADEIRVQAGQFIDRYLENKGLFMSTATENKPADAPAPLTVWNAATRLFEAAPGVTLTADQLAALADQSKPKPAPQPDPEPKPKPEPDPKPPAAAQLSAEELETNRCLQIGALCDAARVPNLRSDFIKGKLSVADVTAKLFHEVTKLNAPLQDAGTGTGPIGAPPDPNAKYKAEYLAAKERCDEAGLSEEQFIASRRVSDDLEPLMTRAK